MIETAPERSPLADVARLFLKLGFTAFGGPAAHVAMMRDEVVRRRGWMSDAHFLDLLGATNLIPGPNSTEMAIHIGHERAGWRGLLTAGALFILPAVGIVLACAWAYDRYGATPQATALVYGIKPVIIAVIAQALLGLGRTALKNAWTTVVAIGVLAGFLLGANEIALLVAAGLVVLVGESWRARRQPDASRASAWWLLPAGAWAAPGALATSPVNLVQLFLVFLKVGSILYGSGYVLVAFLHADLVERLGWLTEQQLLDAVAVGQFTPGPVFTTATFVGYLIGGWGGAALATIGIFLPSFLFVAASNPLVPRLRRSRLFGAFLDGVNAASLALMAGVLWQLGRASLVDVPTVLIALVAGVLLVRYRVNSAWLVLGGAVLGIVLVRIGA